MKATAWLAAALVVTAHATGQVVAWSQQYNGADRSDEGKAVAVSGDGSIYAAGFTENDASNNEAIIIKYPVDGGHRQWVDRVRSPVDKDAEYNAVACAPGGTMVVAAGYEKLEATSVWLVRAYGPSGQVLWTQTPVGNTASSTNEARAMVCGPDGRSYVAGVMKNDRSGRATNDLAVLCFNSHGGCDWVYYYDTNESEAANSIVLGADGNLYVAGCGATANTDRDNLILSLTADGGFRWAGSSNGTGNGRDEHSSIAYGPDGSVYAAGYQTGASTGSDIYVECRAANGARRWGFTQDGHAAGYDVARAITTSPEGDVFYTGDMTTPGLGCFIAVYSVTADGSRRWGSGYSGCDSIGNDRGYAIAASGGLVYAVGSSVVSTGGPADFTIVAFETDDGRQRWVHSINGSRNVADKANAVAVTANGQLVVTGRINEVRGDTAEQDNILTVGLDPFTGIVQQVHLGRTSHLRVAASPFVGSTSVVGLESEVFVVYDNTGRPVGECLGREFGRGLAAGVYHLKQRSTAAVVRVVKLR